MEVDKEVNSPAVVMELGKEVVSFDEGVFMLRNISTICMYLQLLIQVGVKRRM